MDSDTAIVLAGVFYKIVGLLVGLAFGYMGYRLFLADKLNPAGNLSINHEKLRMKIERTAPGTFFSLLGATIIAVSIFKGIEFERKSDPVAKPKTTILPDKPPFDKHTEDEPRK